MPDHPDFITACNIVRTTGAHADRGGNDRWGMPTFNLRIVGRHDRITILTGCRFDRPTETIRRALAAR